MRIIEVLPYDEGWVALFEREEALLRRIFSEELVAIHHIGSTSIKGMKAKPIIDIMPVVKDIDRVHLYDDAMRKIGYEPKGENGINGRRYFQKGGDQRTHHVHIFQEGHPDIQRHLAFRDYVGSHPEAMAAYAKRKEELAEKYRLDSVAYANGKSGLVRQIDEAALAWYLSRAR
ncbi:GrpB family protein [Brevibacillus borstelensis]|uniref:GrpB family protein n=1 Tax=Brevibacillus borstelensis TaxID=45462 RepID=UPI0030BD380E